MLNERQQKAVTKLVKTRGGMVLWKVGRGKTRISLHWFATIAKCNTSRLLVFCRAKTFPDWQQEIAECFPDWTVNTVFGPLGLMAAIKQTNKVPRSVVLISHGMIHSMWDLIAANALAFECVVYDEGFLFKNPRSEHGKFANMISCKIRKALILTGSVMTAKNLEDVWGQLFAIGRQHILARTLTEFRTKFMVAYSIDPNRPQIKKYAAMREAVATIASRIRKISSIYFPKSDREIVEVVRKVPATVEQKRLFEDLRNYMEITIGGKTHELQYIIACHVKAQRISDGVIVMEGEKFVIDSGKFEYLRGIVEGMQEEAGGKLKLVIWTRFIATAKYLYEKFSANYNCFLFTGADRFDIRAWEQKKTALVFATVASGSGVNCFSQVPTFIYYSMDEKWLHLQQSMGRNDRHSSTHKTATYIFLQTEGSLDAAVYKAAKTSKKKEAQLLLQAASKQWLTKRL